MFKPAVRKKVRFKMAISAPSGGGKTYSALLIAKGLVGDGKIALIDTENGSASLYAGAKGIPAFDTVTLGPPFTSARYVEAIKAAVKAGYACVIIDSISHQWFGEGGILDRKDKEQLAKPTLNGYTLWAKYTPEHTAFMQAILQADIHVIVTMRSKTEYILETNDRGKQTPRKVGMAPVQRDGVEYEWSLVIDLADNHMATVSKDRTGLFDGQVFLPGVETGEAVANWLATGAEPDPVAPPPVQPRAPIANGSGPAIVRTPVVGLKPTSVASAGDLCDLYDAQRMKEVRETTGWTKDQGLEAMRLITGGERVGEITKARLQEVLSYMSSWTQRAEEGLVELRGHHAAPASLTEPTQLGEGDEEANRAMAAASEFAESQSGFGFGGPAQ